MKDFDDFLETIDKVEAENVTIEALRSIKEPQDDGITKLEDGEILQAAVKVAVEMSRYELRKYHEWLNS